MSIIAWDDTNKKFVRIYAKDNKLMVDDPTTQTLLGDIQGVGWTDETLKAIKDAIGGITAERGTDSAELESDASARYDALTAAIESVGGGGLGAFADLIMIDDALITMVSGTLGAWPERVFDNVTTNFGRETAAGQYVELRLPVRFILVAYRLYGNVGNAGNGRWKIEYYDGASWQDWITGIPIRTTADWSSWAANGNQKVEGMKIRFTCTTNDTNDGQIAELELAGILYVE